MTKKLILLLMLVTLLIAFFSSASLAAEIKIIFNGTEMKLDQDPIMENGRVLVPFRHIFQAMNMKVDYNFETQEIKAGRGGAVLIELQVDNRYAQVRGEQKILDVAPRLIAKTSRTVVPLRFVTENAGAQVDWDDKTQTVTITYKAAANIYELMENHHPVYTNKGLTIDLSQDMAFFEQGNANIVEYRISTDHKLAEALLDLDQLRWLAQEFVKTVYEIVGNLPDPDAFALIRLYVTMPPWSSDEVFFWGSQPNYLLDGKAIINSDDSGSYSLIYFPLINVLGDPVDGTITINYYDGSSEIIE